jgi:hypothetical protein
MFGGEGGWKMTWGEQAFKAIHDALSALPDTATPLEKKRAIDAAYPFGERAFWPYKAWLKHRALTFKRLGIETHHKAAIDKPKSPYYGLSPLEIAKMKSEKTAVIRTCI